jgi:hypothetical protein
VIRDINHTDDSTKANEDFEIRSRYREHPDVPKMTGDYRFEVTAIRLFTNTTPRP